MPIRTPRLKLRLHMPTQRRLRKHQSPLVMLQTHIPLAPIVHPTGKPTVMKIRLVLQVGKIDDDGFGRVLLETQFAVPGHVLDC